MKADLGVASTTDKDYDEVIKKVAEIKEEIKNASTILADRGWTGEAQKKYSELIRWFMSNEYELLEENLKCMKEVLSNSLKSQGGALKKRCEDFVNCFDGSESGVYPESDGDAQGVLSLEYDNSARIIDNITEITNRLIPQKRDALSNLSKTFNGGWFSSGLLYSSLNIDNELEECFNEIFNEDKRLNAFLYSFVQYTPGVKRLEESVCSGLNKIKDLSGIAENNMSAMDKNLKMSLVDKIGAFGKTAVIDIGGGTVTCGSGATLSVTSLLALPETFGASIVDTGIGGAKVVSGANSCYNGIQDLKRELNGDWSAVDSTNLVKDSFSGWATKRTGSSTIGNIVGSGFMLTIDGAASGKDTISDIKDFYNGVKNVPTVVKDTKTNLNLAKSSTQITNVMTGDYVKLPPIRPINIDAEDLANGGVQTVKGTYKYSNAYYNAKTIAWGDTNASALFSSPNVTPVSSEDAHTLVTEWLEGEK